MATERQSKKRKKAEDSSPETTVESPSTPINTTYTPSSLPVPDDSKDEDIFLKVFVSNFCCD